jgi:hypothetical protein
MECEQTMSDNADRMEMLSRAEMRWMSVEDAEITVTARVLAELGRDWQAAEARVTELEQQRRELYSEVDCRIEHGADSNGHLEYVRAALGEEG